MGLLKQDADGTLKSKITINGTDVLPLAGISNIVTVLCNESGKYEIYESDEHGFHNPKALWNSRPFDIAAVGRFFYSWLLRPFRVRILLL